MEMIENNMIDITETIDENQRYQIATKNYNANSSDYIKTISREYINNSNYKQITESAIDTIINDSNAETIFTNDSTIICSNEKSNVKVTLNTFQSPYNVSSNEIVESNEKHSSRFRFYEDKKRSEKIVDINIRCSPLTSKDLIENEINRQKNILNDKKCDNSQSTWQNLKSSNVNTKERKDKKFKENYNIIPIMKEIPRDSLVGVDEGEKLNIINMKKFKHKMFAKNEFSNNRDLIENNNAEYKNWCSNRKKEISKLNSRKEITKEKCTVFLPFKDNIEYCGYRKHTYNTCGIFKMENLLKEYCITSNINDSKRNPNDGIQIDENICKKIEQNDCNNESSFQEHSKYIKGDVLFEFSKLLVLKLLLKALIQVRINFCFKLMIVWIKLQIKIIIKVINKIETQRKLFKGFTNVDKEINTWWKSL